MSTGAFIAVVALALVNPSAFERPLAERPPEIEYATPQAAEKALRAKSGVELREENGWLVAADKSENTFWSIALRGNPAYPAVVKRTFVERNGKINLEMNVKCGASKAACDDMVRAFQALTERMKGEIGTNARSQAPLPESPPPRQAEAERVATSWLDLLGDNKHVESFALLTDVFKANLTPGSWREAVEATNRDLGKRLSRKLRRIVWYQDPADAPLPGTYAAVEFDSTFENADRHFQYVILHSLAGEPFRIMRNESTFALNGPPGPAAPAAQASEQPALQCNIGPAVKQFGGNDWSVYGCVDGRSVVVIAGSPNPAAPFVFTITADASGGIKLHGEGTGARSATQPAYDSLSAMSAADLAALFQEARWAHGR